MNFLAEHWVNIGAGVAATIFIAAGYWGSA